MGEGMRTRLGHSIAALASCARWDRSRKTVGSAEVAILARAFRLP